MREETNGKVFILRQSGPFLFVVISIQVSQLKSTLI